MSVKLLIRIVARENAEISAAEEADLWECSGKKEILDMGEF